MDFLRFFQTLLVITPDDHLYQDYGIPTREEHDPRQCDFCRKGEYYYSPSYRLHLKL